MDKFPQALSEKLQARNADHSLRQLTAGNSLIDFSSNDYLGFARSKQIFDAAHTLLASNNLKQNGSTGSRLLSGNYDLYDQAESVISGFHNAESALIFNSGYDANIGFFSSVPQKSDVILYDELCHASIRDGIRLSNAASYKFRHNDSEHLEILIDKFKAEDQTIYIATESVFSMDGDTPNLERICNISEKNNCFLIVDEAHAIGVFGENGSGIIDMLNLNDQIFARIVTFGKGLGCHGAAVLGSDDLKQFLINFARSFIYTTALPPHAVATIISAYKMMEVSNEIRDRLRDNISFFGREKKQLGLSQIFIYSKSAIQCAVIPGAENVRSIASQLHKKGFDVKPILSPTVPEGQERLRFCLHSYNTEDEISQVLAALANFVFEK